MGFFYVFLIIVYNYFRVFLSFQYLQQALGNGLSFIYNVCDTFKNGEHGN